MISNPEGCLAPINDQPQPLQCMSTINRWGGQTSHVMDEQIMLTSAKVALKGGRRFAERGPFSAMTLSTGGWYCDPPELTR